MDADTGLAKRSRIGWLGGELTRKGLFVAGAVRLVGDCTLACTIIEKYYM